MNALYLDRNLPLLTAVGRQTLVASGVTRSGGEEREIQCGRQRKRKKDTSSKCPTKVLHCCHLIQID